MPIIHKYRAPGVIERPDDVSPERELYLEQHQPVEITFEMQDEKAWERFNALPQHVLPVLPAGYQWVRTEGRYAAMRHQVSQAHEVNLVLYGPAAHGAINFLCCIDHVTTYSFANTSRRKQMDRKYPMSNDAFRVEEYQYQGKKYQSHVRGHLIDHQDTIAQGKNSSTFDKRNYVPEPPVYDWGMGFRNVKVRRLRKDDPGSAYAQMNDYGHQPMMTRNGTPVPEYVRLYTFNHAYDANSIYHVAFEENMTRPTGVSVLDHGDQFFRSNLEAAPVVSAYNPTQSDRALRYQSRNGAKKDRALEKGTLISRFPEKDRLMAAHVAADFEFETAGRQLHAGILTPRALDSLTSHHFFRRAADSADQLVDMNKKVFKKREIEEGIQFFKSHQDAAHEHEALDALSDRFKQLWSACKGRSL